jgi:hypothetical protein
MSVDAAESGLASGRTEVRGNIQALLFLILIFITASALFMVDHFEHKNYGLLPIWPWAKIVFLCLLLSGILLVARWYKRLGNNSDIEELQKAAFSYRLGGCLALRPFLCSAGESLTSDSPLEEYRKGIQQPEFLRSAINPPFILALALVLSLGLMAFYAEDMAIVQKPSLLLSGPVVAQEPWILPRGDVLKGSSTPDDGMARIGMYQSGALMCVVYALLGSLVWSIAYLARRMSLRDVTPHSFQTIAVRICVSSIVALFLYHLIGKPDPDGASNGILAAVSATLGIGRADILILLSFAAGMIPEVALRWLDMQVRKLFGQSSGSDGLDLEAIEGIDAQTRVRLAEVGIYDAQGLVTTNPLHLTLKTPFSLPQIMDWSGQAFLFLQLKRQQLDELRARGLRTAWQLETVAQMPQVSGSTVDVSQTLTALGQDPCYVRAKEIVDRMRGR